MNAALNSSVKMDWMTPDAVLDLVRQVGRIVLDPATVADNPTGATLYVPHPTHDGLRWDWHEIAESVGGGVVYVNPPYGRALPAWARKIHDEAAKGAEIIALVPARTDTRWFQDHIAKADAVCFWRGRLTFKGAPAPAPFPSAVAYFGPRVTLFLSVFSRVGLAKVLTG